MSCRFNVRAAKVPANVSDADIWALSSQKPRHKVRGSREEVWAGHADRTAGGLTKADLVLQPSGKLASRKAVARGRRLAAQYGPPGKCRGRGRSAGSTASAKGKEPAIETMQDLLDAIME